VSDYLPPVVVELEGRDQKLLDTLTRAKAQVRAFVAEVGRLNATIKVDVKLKDGALAEVRRRVNESPAAKLKVDLQLGAGQRDELRAQLEGRPIQATVKPVMDQAALRRVKDALRVLGHRIDVPIRPDLDDGSVRRARRRLDDLSRNRTVTIRTRVTGDGNRRPGNGSGSDSDSKSPLDGGLLKALLPFAPALMPIAAEATAVAGAVGAATVAVGAFGLAVKSQLGAISGLSDAQGKYNAAVAKYGPASKQASQASQALSQVMDAMPPQTLKAAAAFSNLQGDFANWSKSLAKFTMVPVTQGIAVLDAVLPKLSPLVKDTSAQFTRLTTLLAAGVSSGAFDGLMSRFTTFTNSVLTKAVDGVIHFARVLSQGGGSNTFSQFMEYAKANAPLVKETLANLAKAVLNILKAASQAGPGMLTLVNTFAKLVAALPPSVIATLMQVAAAIKLISLTRAGITGMVGPLQSLGTRLTALRTAASGAGGGLAGLRAAFASLGTATKATLIVAGIAAVAVAVSKLASLGRKAPPDVDKLTNSLGRLGATGQVNGEALKAFGAHLDGLRDSVKSFVAPSELDHIQQGLVKVLTLGISDSTPRKEAKENLDAIDKSLTNLVQGGHADMAAAALTRLKAAYGKGGHDVGAFTSHLKDYKQAVDDAKFAQELAADSQGVFGQQALKVQAALDKQKAAAQGLQQAILDLNDTNRNALDAESAYQQAIDDATAAIKGHRDALHMSNGQLDLNSKKAREAYAPLSQLAAAAEANATATLQQTGSQDKANRVLIDAHAQLVRVARQMGLSSSEANALADKLDNIKDPKIQVTVAAMKAEADLRAFYAAVKASPSAKSVTLKTLSSAAEKVLESFGFKVTHLKNGSVKITASNGQALSAIGSVNAALRALNGRVATTYVKTVRIGGTYGNKQVPLSAHGGLLRRAGGGTVAEMQHFDQGGYIQGPGGPTSDNILASFASGAISRVSNSEYVIQASAVRKYGVALLNALNAGQLRLAGYAKGGHVKKMSQAEKDARSQLTSSFGISYFGQQAGYFRTPFEHGLAVPTDVNALVSSLNQLSGQIKKAFSGKTETSLLKQLDKAGKSLIVYEKHLTQVNAALASAKSKLDDLKNSAAQLKSSVSSSVMQNAGIVTQAPQAGFALTSQDVLNNMASEVSKSIAFSNQLQQLKKRGLSADLLAQIAAAGVDQGGATAAALVGASDSTIKQLNSLQSQVKKSADAAGSAVADSMYGAGIRAAEGLVKGLEKDQKAIEDQMMKIAKGMEKAIKKALGIKSPSTVMAEVGHYTALGLAQGIDSSSQIVEDAMNGMILSVHKGAALAVMPGWTGFAVRGARNNDMVIHNHHYHFNIEGNAVTMDRLSKDVEAAFLRRGMRNPVTYAAYKR
jgi:hypothetical protein